MTVLAVILTEDVIENTSLKEKP